MHTESERKYEDISRKMATIEADAQRGNERADGAESKIAVNYLLQNLYYFRKKNLNFSPYSHYPSLLTFHFFFLTFNACFIRLCLAQSAFMYIINNVIYSYLKIL